MYVHVYRPEVCEVHSLFIEVGTGMRVRMVKYVPGLPVRLTLLALGDSRRVDLITYTHTASRRGKVLMMRFREYSPVSLLPKRENPLKKEHIKVVAFSTAFTICVPQTLSHLSEFDLPKKC